MMSSSNYDHIINSLKIVPNSPFSDSSPDRVILINLLKEISNNDDKELSRLVSNIHIFLNLNLPVKQFLLICKMIIKNSDRSCYEMVIEIVEEFISSKKDILQLNNIILFIMNKEPSSIGISLLLIKIFSYNSLKMKELYIILVNLENMLENYSIGDFSLKLIHLIMNFKNSGISPIFFIKFLTILDELGGLSLELIDNLLEHFPLPFTEDEFNNWNEVRQISDKIIEAYQYDALFSCAINSVDGILPPGCLKWFDEYDNLLSAGYFLSCNLLNDGENKLVIIAEDFNGNISTKTIVANINNSPSNLKKTVIFEEIIKSEIDNHINIDLVNLFYGYLEGYIDDFNKNNHDNNNQLIKKKAKEAYNISKRFQLISEILLNLTHNSSDNNLLSQENFDENNHDLIIY